MRVCLCVHGLAILLAVHMCGMQPQRRKFANDYYLTLMAAQWQKVSALCHVVRLFRCSYHFCYSVANTHTHTNVWNCQRRMCVGTTAYPVCLPQSHNCVHISAIYTCNKLHSPLTSLLSPSHATNFGRV